MSEWIREGLERTPAPGEERARRRAWDVAQAALAEHTPVGRGRRVLRVVVPAVTLAAVAGAVATASSEPVGDWVRSQVRQAVGPPAPLAPLATDVPGGRLLSVGPLGVVIHAAGGPRRVSAAAGAATWSPHGRFVAVARGCRLAAIDLAGRRRWSFCAFLGVDGLTWSSSGFRLAYLSGAPSGGGRVVRIVAGDGTGDHLLAAAGSAPPAWRPGAPHVLAYAGPAGHVVVRDVDSGRVLWRARPADRPIALSWSPDGRRLLVLGKRWVSLLPAPGAGVPRLVAAPPRELGVTAAYAPRGDVYAVVRRVDDESRIILGQLRGGERLLLATPGRVRSIAWSPDGRTLAVDPDGSGGWLLLRVAGGRLASVRTLSGTRGSSLAGWCCRP